MRKKQAGTITAAGRGIAEGRVGVEAVTRVGRNPQVKGVVHEVLYRDLQNASAKNVVNGTKAVLTKSTTAVRDDILMKQGTSIVGRAQLKDTPKAIAKTVSQVRSGHYAGTNLMGTTETVAAYNKAVANAAKNGVKITQQMTDTGISSLDTGRIATQTIGQAAGCCPAALRLSAPASSLPTARSTAKNSPGMWRARPLPVRRRRLRQAPHSAWCPPGRLRRWRPQRHRFGCRLQRAWRFRWQSAASQKICWTVFLTCKPCRKRSLPQKLIAPWRSSCYSGKKGGGVLCHGKPRAAPGTSKT